MKGEMAVKFFKTLEEAGKAGFRLFDIEEEHSIVRRSRQVGKHLVHELAPCLERIPQESMVVSFYLKSGYSR